MVGEATLEIPPNEVQTRHTEKNLEVNVKHISDLTKNISGQT